MKAEIITVGDELLIGQTIDTNSCWIGRQLTSLGFTISQKTAIQDKREAIVSTLSESMKRAKLVLVTGGLGPTKDDITKHTLCEFFNTRLVFHHQAYANAERFVNERGGTMNEGNKSQGLLPEACTFIPNNNGTASGMWFERDGCVVVSMPGVPHEMEQMMADTVIGKIKSTFDLPTIIIRYVNTAGIAESRLAELIAPWEDSLPDNCKLAYLPSPGVVKLRLNAYGTNREELEKQADSLVEKLVPLIKEYIFSFDDADMASVVGSLLVNGGKTVSVAESCSGGYLAHILTLNPGSSAYFKGSVTAYSNSVKTNVLGVPAHVLEQHGAVSQQVVELMAQNVRTVMETDYGVATSGIAGPGGGTVDKPVGTVWIAVCGPLGTCSQHFSLGNDRPRVIQRTAINALDITRKVLSQMA